MILPDNIGGIISYVIALASISDKNILACLEDGGRLVILVILGEEVGLGGILWLGCSNDRFVGARVSDKDMVPPTIK